MDITMSSFHVLVIGGGSTGAALAHDLALRGLAVTLVERGEIASGTTGRNHCLLHSGGRYCMTDKPSAVECAQENAILRRIMPNSMELNDGLFIALEEADLTYRDRFQESCSECGIAAEWLTPKQVLALEPNVSSKNLGGFRVPDGVFEPLRFCLSFLASAKHNGARVLPFNRVEDLTIRGHSVHGIKVRDRKGGGDDQIGADIVVNAAGPWASEIGSMADVVVPLEPTPGVMISLQGRHTQRVINRLGLPSDGDIVVPQRETSIVGTTSWKIKNADYIPIPEDHVDLLLERGQELVPALADSEARGVFAVARPLIQGKTEDQREVPRSFVCIDHASEGAEGLITVLGGKTTTARAMAEAAANLVCAKLGIEAPCRTREIELLPYRAYYVRND
jgi:glycerol-3-phosphate dehydrogenase